MKKSSVAATGLMIAVGISISSPAESQSVRPKPGGDYSDEVEYCRNDDFYKSIGDCMGYLLGAPPTDRQEFCRTIQEFQPGLFATMGDCIEYISSLQDRFERP